MAIGKGYGKTIFFNEHFVVYGIPSIASAINHYTEAEVDDMVEGSGFQIIDNRLDSAGKNTPVKIRQREEALTRMFNSMGIDTKKNPIKITLGGTLSAFSGIGASAALCVATARAAAKHFGLHFTDEEINEFALEGEKGFAGNPSGVDNTAATFGKMIWYVRGDSSKGEKNVFELITLPKPVEIVIADSGITANTKAQVEGVAERRRKYPEKYAKLFKEAEELAYRAREAVEKADFKKMGELMNENHKMLQGIEVSHEELDKMVAVTLENGAYGAKMTGGGGGGCMLALTPGIDLQEKVAFALEGMGKKVLRTTVG